MIIKKLLAPLVNERILLEAEHCYVACASISEPAYDFIVERISKKCELDIVTGLDLPTSPEVLRKIVHFNEKRTTLRVYTGNFFHANTFMFDLPYRKQVAFVGSGGFTLNGLKDNEELFYKITAEKEIEKLKSWFTGYFDFALDLNEKMIDAYVPLYEKMMEREKLSREEKKVWNEQKFS